MSDLLQVLVVEDNDIDWLALSRRFASLTHRYHVDRVSMVAAAADSLASSSFDCVLLDVNLPDGSGLDLLDSVGSAACIVMTGEGEASVAVSAMKRGAADFVEKQTSGEHLTLLPELIERAHKQKCDERELEHYRNELEQMVNDRTQALEAEVARRSQVEADLKALLQVKESLLQEVHHRVKNNLQVVSSLLSLQADSSESPAANAVLTASTQRIHAMALVHEQIYQSASLADVNLTDYIRELCAFLSDGYDGGHVTLSVEGPELHISLDVIIPIGLIATELVSNSYKYAFAPSHADPRITITAHESPDGALELTIKDNGCGMPDNTESAARDSLGLSIVHVLTDQLHGTIEQRSNDGTSWTLTVPLPGQSQSAPDGNRQLVV